MRVRFPIGTRAHTAGRLCPEHIESWWDRRPVTLRFRTVCRLTDNEFLNEEASILRAEHHHAHGTFFGAMAGAAKFFVRLQRKEIEISRQSRARQGDRDDGNFFSAAIHILIATSPTRRRLMMQMITNFRYGVR